MVMFWIVLQFVVKGRACGGNSLKTFAVELGIIVLQMSNYLPSMCVFTCSSILAC